MENGNVHQSGQDRRERGIPVLAVRDVMTDRQTRKRQINDLPFLEVPNVPSILRPSVPMSGCVRVRLVNP